MRVCINTWALYNEGLHLGTWCGIADYEDVLDELKELQVEKGLDDDIEPFLADWDEDELNICTENVQLEYLKEVYEKFDELEEYEKKKLTFLVDYQGYEFFDALERLEDCDIYEDMSMEQLAEHFVDEGLFGDIPKSIINYIDYEAIARDLQYDYTEYAGDIFRHD